MSEFEPRLFSEWDGVLADTRVLPRVLPELPQIQLWLLADDFPTDSVSQEEYVQVMSAPPYWAFCWGGGQALSRYLYDHPEWVKGRRIVDFGAGSGVAAIAALGQGAASALAVDCDQAALLAARHNAELNNVLLETASDMPPLSALERDWDLILAADVCYEESGFEWLKYYLSESAAVLGPEILLADSRYSDLDLELNRLEKVAKYQVRTFPDLDEAEQFDWVTIYRTRR